MALIEVIFGRVIFAVVLLLTVLNLCHAEDDLYQFNLTTAKGLRLNLELYRGKVALLVNVATHCGFTDSHYKQLSAFEKNPFFSRKDFVVLAFPCNQFGSQEPGNTIAIERWVRETYGGTFPIFEKVEVTGSNQHPLWKFVEEETGQAPAWNFWKYLVNRSGHVIKAYPPTVPVTHTMMDITNAIMDKGMKHIHQPRDGL